MEHPEMFHVSAALRPKVISFQFRIHSAFGELAAAGYGFRTTHSEVKLFNHSFDTRNKYE